MKNSGVEWIGEIPDDWKITKILNCLRKRISDGPHETPTYVENGIPFISVDSLNETEYVDLSFVNRYISEEDYLEYSKKANLEENDILFSKAATIGKTAIVHADEKFMVWSPIAILKTNSSLDNRFLYFLLNYDGLITHISFLGSINTQINVGMRELEQARIPLPPKSTQQRIASYLDIKCSKIEETIQNQQQVIEKLKAYKQSLITEAVTGKIKIQNGKVCGKYESYKESGVEYLGKIPSNWNVKRLRYIGKCQNGISKGGEFFGSGYPFVSYGDVYNNLTLPETVSGLIESTPEEQENYSVKAGDIFFTRTSETIEEVGFTSVCLKTIENATFAGFVIRVRPFTYDLIPEYSKYYFSSNAHRRFFVKEMNLVTRASLSQDLLKRLPVLIPSKEDQKEIADYLDKKCTAIDTAIEQKQKLIEKLTEYKKSLIYECVTGKKEIKL